MHLEKAQKMNDLLFGFVYLIICSLPFLLYNYVLKWGRLRRIPVKSNVSFKILFLRPLTWYIKFVRAYASGCPYFIRKNWRNQCIPFENRRAVSRFDPEVYNYDQIVLLRLLSQSCLNRSTLLAKLVKLDKLCA
uniref:Uncharacterized protein n=1 Tax=Glossina pallidipes TaxID=7398 RepID=A0A1A9ZUC8_GLOPL